MLRSFDILRDSAQAEAVIVSGEERLALKAEGKGYAMPWHWHDCLMLLLPVRGAVELRGEDQPAASWVSKDRFALVPNSRAHRTRSVRDRHVHVALYLTEPALRRVEDRFGSLDRVRRETRGTALFATTPRIRALLDLCRDTSAGTVEDVSVLDHVSSALLTDCLAQVERVRTVSAASLEAHGASLAREVGAYLAARLGDTVTLNEIAERFGVSRRHLTRSFRHHTGRTIADVQQAQRLAAARRLLADTDLPVGKIAFRVGFDSGSALARAMRRESGLSPSGIRNMARPVAR